MTRHVDLLLVSIVGLTLCIPPSARSQTNPTPLGSKVTLSGSMIGPDRMAPLVAGTAVSSPANPFVLPILKPPAYDQTAVVSALNYVFTNFPNAKSYSMYFQLMPWQIDLQQMGASIVLSKPPGKDVLLQPYTLSDTTLGIHAMVPKVLVGLDVFKAVQPPGMDSGPASSIFITLDGFGAQVPISVAASMEANFIDGFVTRLVLGQYQAFWKSNAADYGALPSNFSIDIGTVNANQGDLLLYSDPATYPKYQPDSTGKLGPSFEQDLSAQLAASPIASIGMLYGWRAAEQLEKIDQRDPSHQLLKAAWTLLKYRFNFERIGEMTAYTLNYLSGAAENSRIQQIAQGQTPAKITDLNAIVAAVGSDPKIIAAKKFLISFQNVTEAEFYALARNTQSHFDSTERRRLVTEYYNFIVGLHDGIAKSADQHYIDSLDLAFGLGYNAGFRDGYSVGYAAGFADGFAAGSAAAWQAANVIISSLQNQISSLQSQLSQAQSAANGGGAGSGFWNNLGNIVSTVGSVVGTIASFF
jgi:hypothetical protein